MDATFGKKIRDLRNRRNWSVYDLAEKLGKTPGYVSKIEARGEIPSPQIIIKLAVLLDAKPEDLIEIAKAEKTQEVSRVVQRKFDEGLALYRKGQKD